MNRYVGRYMALLGLVGTLALGACGGLAPMGGEGQPEASSTEAGKADGVRLSLACPLGTMKTDLALEGGSIVSACVKTNQDGALLVSEAPAGTSIEPGSESYDSGTNCKFYGSIYCCWNSQSGWCVSVSML